MVAQAYVDESGGKGSTRHFVLAGLVGSSEAWAEFSDEWAACLKQHPAIPAFKMKHAAGRPSGHFRGMSEQERDDKLRSLARVINRYPKLATFSVIDLEAHAKTWAKMPKPHSDIYFWPFQNTIMAVCHELWDKGWRERFEIIYDEEVIFGPRAKLWYPVIRRALEIKFPEQATILPTDPLFKSDDEFLPLQAADMFAWIMRDAADKQNPQAFSWLLDEMPNVISTDHSQFYDFKRMKAVMEDAFRIRRENEARSELTAMYKETQKLMKRR
jgi:Protein of unknown function (DUF3800)